MQPAEAYFIDLASRASTLWERAATCDDGETVPPGDEKGLHRLARWQSIVAGTDAGPLFSQRLALEDISRPQAIAILSSSYCESRLATTPWIAGVPTLLTRVASERASNNAQPDAAIDPSQPIPFEEFFLPFVQLARQRISRLPATLLQQLSPTAWGHLERQLLDSLARTGAFCVGRSFESFRLKVNPLAIGKAAAAVQRNTSTLYRQFIDELRGPRLASFLAEYPFLARVLLTSVDQWCGALEELCRRFKDDAAAIADSFPWADSGNGIVDARIGFSDRHHGGRTVIVLTCASGNKLVYKPRGLAMEGLFCDLLSWLNDNGTPIPLKPVRSLDRVSHGWMEHVSRSECESADDVSRYYQRTGALLCLVYLLEGVDCHCENLIADGEHPVLIDLETLFHPRIFDEESRRLIEGGDHASGQMEHSVLWTGLLPSWELGPQGKSFDISGLGGTGDQHTGFPVRTWQHVNTDAMCLAEREGITRPRLNDCLLAGAVQRPWNHTDDIANGFEHQYRFFWKHVGSLLADSGPIASFKGVRARVLVRPTSVYSDLLDRFRHPEYLRDGTDSCIETDSLIPSLPRLPQDESVAAFWGAYLAERTALAQRDVPYFYCLTDRTTLHSQGAQCVDICASRSSFDCVAERISGLNEDDLLLQVGLIRAALHARKPKLGTGGSAALTRIDDAPGTQSTAPFDLVRSAVAIADDICANAFYGADGTTYWITFSYDTIAATLRLEPSGDDFYSGRAGIAFFLAAVADATGEARFEAVIRGAVKPLRALARRCHAGGGELKGLPLGGGSGIGGAIYAMARTGRFLDDKELLADARAMARCLTPDIVSQDRTLDLLSGSAGAIVALLAAHEVTHDDVWIDAARICGMHLIATRCVLSPGRVGWNVGFGPQPLTGLSHGAAGIAYALARLSKATGDDRFLRVAEEAIAYEANVYCPDVNNWPDFRNPSGKERRARRFGTTWCHGAPGIGLARLGGLPRMDSEQVRTDIRNAVRHEMQADLEGPDHLCCGNFGRIALLWEAGRRLKDRVLVAESERRISNLLQRRNEQGSFVLNSAVGSQVYSPSLFIGTAGIGYQLLRVASPDRYPCVLLWE